MIELIPQDVSFINVYFTDLQGKLLSVTYVKDFFISSYDNLTFDGSSVSGFSKQEQSDLRLEIDQKTLKRLPEELFGEGFVMFFANVKDQNGNQYSRDFRGLLEKFVNDTKESDKISFCIAPEIEGFLFDGIDAELSYKSNNGFSFITNGGYFSSLPNTVLMDYLLTVVRILQGLGFEIEKYHQEVANSQFEINYRYSDPVDACDKIQIYKLICRAVANSMGLTACFLPKPIDGINGSGMHLNISIAKEGSNLFYSKDIGNFGRLSKMAESFAYSICDHAPALCAIWNSSINAYRRLDPKYEAPVNIKISNTDRSSMIRIPLASEKATRIEIRSVAPDCNPYLCLFTTLSVANFNTIDQLKNINTKLPKTLSEALKCLKNNETVVKAIGKEASEAYCDIKSGEEIVGIIDEIVFHHEIRCQNTKSGYAKTTVLTPSKWD